MQAVILAAGLGLRLRPLTEKTPKTLIPVQGEPILEHILKALPDTIDEIFIVTGHLGKQIKKYLGRSWHGKTIRYVEQKNLSGTGVALHLLKGRLQGRFLVINGDDLYAKSDLENLIQYAPALLARPGLGPAPSTLELDKHNRLFKIRKNPKQNESVLRNTGAYCLDERFFNLPLQQIQTHNKLEYSLPHTLGQAESEYRPKVLLAKFWQPIGTAVELEQAQKIKIANL